MIEALSIAAAALALLALRQNLLVVLGVAAGMAYWFWGDGQIQNIINDGWDGLNRDVLLSIPMYLLAGAVMARGAIARRLIRLARALSAPVPGGACDRHGPVLRHVRRRDRFRDRGPLGHWRGDVSGIA